MNERVDFELIRIMVRYVVFVYIHWVLRFGEGILFFIDPRVILLI